MSHTSVSSTEGIEAEVERNSVDNPTRGYLDPRSDDVQFFERIRWESVRHDVTRLSAEGLRRYEAIVHQALEIAASESARAANRKMIAQKIQDIILNEKITLKTGGARLRSRSARERESEKGESSGHDDLLYGGRRKNISGASGSRDGPHEYLPREPTRKPPPPPSDPRGIRGAEYHPGPPFEDHVAKGKGKSRASSRAPLEERRVDPSIPTRSSAQIPKEIGGIMFERPAELLTKIEGPSIYNAIQPTDMAKAVPIIIAQKSIVRGSVEDVREYCTRAINHCIRANVNLVVNYINTEKIGLLDLITSFYPANPPKTIAEYNKLIDVSGREHFTVFFRNMNFKCHEEIILRDILTFEGLLPPGNECVVGINIPYAASRNIDVQFQGYFLVAYASENLMKMAVAFWNKYIFDYDSYKKGLAIHASISERGVDYQQKRMDRAYGSSRWFEKVWDTFPPLEYQRGWTRDLDRLRRQVKEDQEYEAREEMIR